MDWNLLDYIKKQYLPNTPPEKPKNLKKMIEIAKNQFPNLLFYVQDAEKIELNEKFDYIILSDLLSSLNDIQNVFKPFYRSDVSRATHGGSGLGLSIVQRIIELHKGTISVESVVNQGSTFNMTIPLKQAEK